MRGIPKDVVCYSSAIRPFLNYLDEWRAKNHNSNSFSINTELSQINLRVADRVFGPVQSA